MRRGNPPLSVNAVLRRAGLLAGDAVLLLLAFGLAYWVEYDGHAASDAQAHGGLMIVAADLAVKLVVFGAAGLYALSVPQLGMEDMGAVLRAAVLGAAAFWGTVLVLRRAAGWAVPADILLTDAVLTLCLITGSRLALRRWCARGGRARGAGSAALIVGAGVAGEQLASSLRTLPDAIYTPVGFLDDDRAKHGSVIHGLRVMGSLGRLPEVVRAHGVRAVLIAMPSAPSRAVRSAVSLAQAAGVREVRIIPGLDRILQGQARFTDLQQVQLDDLLGRQVVRIDAAMVERWLRDRRVLVTGAAGSIGSELCRQIASFRPREIIPLDYDETGLFWIERELRRSGRAVTPVLEDVRDARRMRAVFQRTRPDVVFHAAAYKHVGLMERHPLQAVRTNVLGTWAVASAACDAGVETFVLISTDKAVAPTSMMGATKRAAEQVCLAVHARGATRYVAVRFGNVLGSRGSVVPLFQQNIRRGEPITVRGEQMRRYFMATSEAVLLVLQAGAMGEGGEVFVLDMGEPVRILDLAEGLIRLSGLRPHTDVPIVITAPEPGEKEHEDLLTAEEGTLTTQHDRIFVARGRPVADAGEVLDGVAALETASQAGDLAGALPILQALVPMYRPSALIAGGADRAAPAAAGGEVPAPVRADAIVLDPAYAEGGME